MFGRIQDLLRDFFRKGAMCLLCLCLFCSLYGLVLIYSSTRYDPALHSLPMKQFVFLVMGLFIYVVLTMVDIELILEKSWKFLFAGGVILLLMLIPFGEAGGTGNRSWMFLPGLPVGLQPAELVKVPFLLVLARIFEKNQEHGPSRPSSVFLVAGYTLLFAGLITVLSGDFGMVLVYLLLFVIMAWAAGLSWRWFALGFGMVGGLFGGIAVLANTSESFMRSYGYIIRRFTEVFTRDDPQGVGWQQTRSLLAIGSGQLTGQGFLKGNLTQSIYETSLPARHTDEIFAVCGEEFGLIGCVFILAPLIAIVLRCVWVAKCSRTPLSSYISLGIAGMILIQTTINVAMWLYLFPVVGLTLPFFSYGGSSILTLYAAMGIVSGIRMRFLPSWLRNH